MSRFHPLWGRLWGVFDTPLRLGTCNSSKYRCDFPTEYVRPLKKLSRFCPLRGRLWGVFNTPLRPGMCGPSKNCLVFVPFGDACGAYAIRPYDRVCAALQKTIPFSPPSVAYGGAYTIRPYDRVRVAFQKNVPFSSPSGPSVGRMRYAPTTGYVRPFKKLSRFRPLRGRGVGVCDTPLRPGMCGPSKNCPVFVPFGAVCGAYAIRPYGWVCAILRNTDMISRLEGRGRLGCGAVGATVCGGDGRE